jgi:DNA-binding MurR/RpiR family transcriptional regulator
MQGILAHISTNYYELTPSQQRVAQYIYNNASQALLLNSSQIAKTAHVSEATVTRFVGSLGFSGFSEFRREIARQLLEDFSTTRRLAESAESLEGRKNVFSGIIMGDIENIRALPKRISDELFEKALCRLCATESFYVLGLRSSYALAFDLRSSLDKVLLVKPGIGDIPEQVIGAKKGDVLVVISFKRYTRESVNIAEKMELCLIRC